MTAKNTTDATLKLALALLEIAQEMDKGDKADVRWLLDCSATLYAAASAVTEPTTDTGEHIMPRRPARWELHTIPADIVHRLPSAIAKHITETLRYRIGANQSSNASREYAAKCLAALTAMEN